tara:strand:- start:1461 stop:3032 length:1572 start_codon:yes stop_codon:yes gene_type:complete
VKTFIQKQLYKLKPTSLAQKPFLMRALIIFLSGAACALALPPYGLWPFFYLGFSVFFLTLSTIKTKKSAFLFGWLFGLGYFLLGLNWIGNALLVDGNEFAWVWPLAVIALPASLGLFTGLASLSAFIVNKKWNIPLFISLCLTLILTEYARGHLFTGFPWNLFGYIWSDTLSIAQSAALLGPYGLTFLTLLWAIIPINFITKKTDDKLTYKVAISTLIIAGLFGLFSLKKPIDYNETVQVQIVQPNISQAEKWDSALLPINLNKHIHLSKRQKDAAPLKTVIVWPETALGPILVDSSAARELINGVLQEHPEGSMLLTGALATDFLSNNIPKSYNAVTAITKNTPPQHVYSKSHLVPFGEYIPLNNILPLETITGFSGFMRGNGAKTISLTGIPSFSPMVCYEVIFPEAVVDRNNRPEWLLNVTNDAWYGKSAGPYQHFAQTRFRAIEQGLPLVRAANTGISGIIDPKGRTIASQNLMEHGLIISKLPKPLPKTLYARYGEAPFLILMLLLVAILFYRRQSQV